MRGVDAEIERLNREMGLQRVKAEGAREALRRAHAERDAARAKADWTLGALTAAERDRDRAQGELAEQQRQCSGGIAWPWHFAGWALAVTGWISLIWGLIHG